MKKVVFIGTNLLGVLSMARRAGKLELVKAYANVGDFANNVREIERQLGLERADWELGAVELAHAPPSQRIKRTHSLRALIQWAMGLPEAWLEATGNAYIVASLHKGAGKTVPLLGAWVLPKYVPRGSKAARKLHEGQVVIMKEKADNRIHDLDWVVVDPEYLTMCNDNDNDDRKKWREMGRGPPLQLPTAAAAAAVPTKNTSDVPPTTLKPRKKQRLYEEV